MYYPLNIKEPYLTEYATINFTQNIIEAFTYDDEFYKISPITNNIFLSGVMIAQDIVKIKEYNIKCIINCTKHIPTNFNITYLRVPIDDGYNQDINVYFDETFNFIETSIKNNQNVLVHCHAGISRSSTILIAYFMRKNKWNLQQALKFIKSKRSIVNPNPDFMKALEKYTPVLS